MRILFLEDDVNYAELMQRTLQERGYEVQWFDDGSRLIRHLENMVPDLLLLDWSVRGVSGLDVLYWVRERHGRNLPVLFVTNHIRESEIVTVLDAGADDYMIKPVRTQELLARINALLRRSYPKLDPPNTRFRVGRYVIDVPSRTIYLDDEVMETTPREFEIALMLFRNFGRIVSRENLIKRIWGRDLDKTSRSLDTHIYRIRRKLKIGVSTALRLRVVYTHGYRLESGVPEETGDDQ